MLWRWWRRDPLSVLFLLSDAPLGFSWRTTASAREQAANEKEETQAHLGTLSRARVVAQPPAPS